MTARALRSLPLVVALLAAPACTQDADTPEPAAADARTAPSPAGDPSAASVDLVFLANEGFMLRGAHDTVLLDAFLEKPLGAYGALPPEVTASLRKAEAPFDAVDLVLVSHPHPDHHQLELAQDFLAASPETMLPGSPQVTSLLRPQDAGADDPRFPSFVPERGTSITRAFGEVTVEFLRLRHGGRTWDEIHNLGHLVTLDGLTFLHLGDVDVEAAQFEPFDLPARDLDVIFVPYWFFFSTEGRVIVADHLKARWLVPVHVPPAEVSEVATHLAMRDDVVMFGEALETRTFRRGE